MWSLALFALLTLALAGVGTGLLPWLAVGALAADLALLEGSSAWTAWGVFAGTSAALALAAPALGRSWRHRRGAAPGPVLAGQLALVTETIDPARGKGQVRLASGAHWLAMAPFPIPAQSLVEVRAVVGTRLRVHPVAPEAPGGDGAGLGIAVKGCPGGPAG